MHKLKNKNKRQFQGDSKEAEEGGGRTRLGSSAPLRLCLRTALPLALVLFAYSSSVKAMRRRADNGNNAGQAAKQNARG